MLTYRQNRERTQRIKDISNMITYTISFKTRYEVIDKPSGVRPTTSITLNNFRRNNYGKDRKQK